MNPRRSIFVAIVLAGLTVGLPAVAAVQSDRPQDGYWYCYSIPSESPIYVTPVWDARAVPYDVQQEYRKVLAAKYNYKNIVMCATADRAYAQNSVASQEKSKALQIAAWQKDGKKIVEVAWTSKEPPIGPAPIHWSACGAMIVAKGGTATNGPFEMYVSAPFDAGQAGVREQQDAFAAFLRMKYGITTTDLNPQCTPTADEAGARGAIKYWTTRASVNGKLIDTSWKFAK